MKHKVVFFPSGKEALAREGEKLLSVAAKADVGIFASCAGLGICRKCRVILLEGEGGQLSDAEKKYLTKEEVLQGCRLACQLKVHSDLTVFVPEKEKHSDRKKQINVLPQAMLEKLRLEAEQMPLPEIRDMAEETEINCEKVGQKYGISVDIGTTTVVTMLWNLNTMSLLDTEAASNPQGAVGPDVISRIQYAMEEKHNTDKLHGMIIDCINRMITVMCQRNHIKKQSVCRMTVAGNTVMSHLFLGINPAGFACAPFTPGFRGEKRLAASDLRLNIYPKGTVWVLPNIDAHVGSDMTCVMLFADVISSKDNLLIIDIGTNGEILVASDGQMKVCSTAAGPAFEGAAISHGMRAANGAIEKVRIEDDVELTVIGKTEPAGICGSGLIDLMAALLEKGILKSNGNLLTKEEALQAGVEETLAKRLRVSQGQKEFVLYYKEENGDIVITQKDIREIQLAKGAVIGGIKTLMKSLSVTEKQLDRVMLAGAFGSYIRKESAVRIGLLPNVAEDKIISLGNGAGAGASMALLSEKMRKKAEEITELACHVELSQDADFQNYYINGMNFPEKAEANN